MYKKILLEKKLTQVVQVISTSLFYNLPIKRFISLYLFEQYNLLLILTNNLI
jgi:hypothetical protein